MWLAGRKEGVKEVRRREAYDVGRKEGGREGGMMCE